MVCANRGVYHLVIHRLNRQVQKHERVARSFCNIRNLQRIHTTLGKHTVIKHERKLIPGDCDVLVRIEIRHHIQLNIHSSAITTKMVLKHSFIHP